MKNKDRIAFESLKEILKHARSPEELDGHPWTRSLIVQEALADRPALRQVNPGEQLISALTALFSQLQPSHPPRRGLRIDSRWGEFGLLAALYFMPYHNGSSFPPTLMEAWGQIDPAILYFVFGQPQDGLEEAQIREYQLVGDDLENGAASTLSDWHRKGLQRLTEIALNRERFLARNAVEASSILDPERGGSEGSPKGEEIPEAEEPLPHKNIRRWVFWTSLLFILVLALGLGGFKTWKIYVQGQRVYAEVVRLRDLLSAPLGLETLEQAGPALGELKTDLAGLQREVEPFLELAPKLAWVPVYGGDLAAAPELLEMAEHLVEGASMGLQAAGPIVEEVNSGEAVLGPTELTAALVQAQPALLEVRSELDRALLARNQIQVESLSPRLQSMLVDELDPLLALADEGLSLAAVLPEALGGTPTGPKTYLLLVQNEDELRPTGGFITTVGKLVLHNGEVISLEFEGVDYQQEDWSKPYPLAPWQLQKYMNSRVLILRDANWFTDFPTSVQWVEYLYAYTHAHSVDGVIAFDQQFLVMLLEQLGPLETESASYPLTAGNVIDFMREAKEPPPDEPVTAEWNRKEFMGEIAGALLADLQRTQVEDWRKLAKVLPQALAERHLLLQFDDPELTALLSERGWDNALQPGEGDFLMSVDTNIGFNKTSALVETSLAYDVELSDLSAPKGILLVSHSNSANDDVPCLQWGYKQLEGVEWYPVNRCYWNYLRVYKQAGAELVGASPHVIPAEWTLLERAVPPRVDELDEEMHGGQGYGTLVVVPGGQTVNTGFEFALPASVISPANVTDANIYRLTVQKQPGTLANKLTVRVHLPARARVGSVSAEAVIQGEHILVETNLRTDLELEIVFSLN